MIVSIQCHFSQVTWSKFIHSAQDFSCEHQVNSVNQLCLQHILCRGDVKNWDVILTAHDLLSCNQQSSSSHVMKSAAVKTGEYLYEQAGRLEDHSWKRSHVRFFVPALCEHFPILLSDTLVTRCISHLYQSYWDEYRWEKHLVTTSKGRYIELPGQLKNVHNISHLHICMYIYPLYNSHLYQSYFEREREPTMLSVIKFHSSSSFNWVMASKNAESTLFGSL